MSRSELDAAGITDPALRTSYAACRSVNARHGRTYFLATRLLPADRRPAVHALYAFARHADDIVDTTHGIASAAERERRLTEWATRFRDGVSDDMLLPAVHDTIARYAIERSLFEDFLASMRMDLEVTEYPTYDDLERYMYGSAAVIGLQLLPVLGTVPGMAQVAAPYARDLGLAFQLANLVRDVGEDLRRGRVYLPKAELAAFGVTRDDLESGVVDGRIRRLLAFQVARAGELFRTARPGIRLLDPVSRDCVRTAFTLYAGILDEVERNDYRVLDRRVSVGIGRRAAVAVPGLLRAHLARRPAGAPRRPPSC
jgi:phytoene synthase